MNKKNKNSVAIILATILCFSTAHAGTITDVDAIVGSGLGDVQGLLLFSNQANNDNSPNAAGENAVGYDEVIFDQVGEIDIVFNVADSGGITEYSAFFSIFNFTADTWAGIKIELGLGSGDTFQAVPTGTGLDFDIPDMDPIPSSNLFSSVTHTENALSFVNGNIPFGFVDAIFFSIDVPDGFIQITLRLTPATQDVSCSDIDRFGARCQTDGTIQMGVKLTDSSHAGESITIAIDGDRHVLTIAGARAVSENPGFSGLHVVSLDDPSLCQADVIVDCPSGQKTLTVALAGDGAGTVTSVPAGIDCGATCVAVYDSGMIVTLSARPDAGSVFAGFSGDADCGDGNVTMSTTVNCTASFELKGIGAVPCADIDRFGARCLADGTIQTRVILPDTTHAGKTVTIAIDGTQRVLTILGASAETLAPGFSGLHTVSLDDPEMCHVAIPVSCP